MSPDDRLLVVTAVRAETRAVLTTLRGVARRSHVELPRWEGRSGARAVSLLQTGIGPHKARAALAAVDEHPILVVSVGFAGALVGGAAPGDVVLPEVVAWDDGTTTRRYRVPSDAWRAAKAALSEAPALRMLTGELFSSPEIVATPAAKRALAARTGTVAVEMESAGLIDVARERGVGFLALRVILDPVDTSLEDVPPDLDSSWRARAKLAVRPTAWPAVLAIARHLPRASEALRNAVGAVLPVLPAAR